MFDWSAETGLTNRRPFVRLEDGIGYPDGLTVDAEGGVWTALFGGSAVRRYDADGSLSEIVEVGPSLVTCPAFGGDDLDQLFITTSRENLPDDAEPDTGALGGERPFFGGFDRGVPDGSAVDAAGRLWNCRFDGACVVCVAPTGEIEAMCLELAGRAVGDERQLRRLKIPQDHWDHERIERVEITDMLNPMGKIISNWRVEARKK